MQVLISWWLVENTHTHKV